MKNQLSILIIDAEINSCKEMQEFLIREGFLVLPATSADEGQLLLTNNPVDILILEICLPGANGLEFIKISKSRFPELDVIVISGQGDMNSVIEAMHLGVLDFLAKPLRQDELMAAIERSKKNPCTQDSFSG
jgi:two-component system, NtrC family, response regulator